MTGMNKKGQGAMEYLMTYGWAILVVMIVGIVLWQLGIFGGAGGCKPSGTGFATIKPLEKTIYAGTAGNNVTVKFANGAMNNIAFAAGAINATGCTMIPPTSTAATVYTGGSINVAMIPSGWTTGTVAGTPFECVMTMTYTENVAGMTQTHVEHGIIRGCKG